MSAIKVGIITVSDTASVDAAADRSGPTIQEIIQQRGHGCVRSTILPDDEQKIRETVKNWCYDVENTVDWIISTGGTGFGVRDRTPEAISPLLEREAAGIVHLLLAESLKRTPLAALSRPVAGTVGNTLIVTLPGSVKAVKENLEALFANGFIEHAIDLIRGGTGKQPRSILSHDPSLPVHARHRVSPYPQISLEDALNMIGNEIQPLGVISLPVTPALAGNILGEDVYAPQDVPSAKTTNVDGYALRSSDPPGTYKVLTSRTHALTDILPEGSIFRINTGGPLPEGTDAVIMVEDTELLSTVKDANGQDAEEKEVKTLTQVPPSDNTRAPGSDVHKGDLVLQRGEVLTGLGGEVGTLTFVGRKEVKVHRKPVVAILSTGNELLDLQSPNPLPNDGWGGIWDTNRPSLRAALEGMGYNVVDLGIVPDDINAHVKAIKQGLESADLLLTTGGTSMGAGDLLKPVIERQFGGTIHFGRVSMKPGKPTTFASIPTTQGEHERKFMFALPGNPASALVTFYIFVIPALRKLGGWPGERCHLPRVRVKLGDAMRLDPRVEFHRVIVKAGEEGLRATSTGGQRSSRVASLTGANGLVQLPRKKEGGPDKLEAGSYADAVIIGELQM
ncbi:MoaB/Mog domain-containing protein [Suillus spraguei]|nr:MoaB/Mog domain-containing protein [Suillus spraguei]